MTDKSQACSFENEVDVDVEFDHGHNAVRTAPIRNNSPMAYSSDEYRVFRSVDRESEDDLVIRYRKTKDEAILLRLMLTREQTFRHMAKRYAYLDNEDDMYSEFKSVWLKCVNLYDDSIRMRQLRTKSGEVVMDKDGKPRMIAKKTPFNTYLYTSMKNRVGNIYKRNHSKRLCDEKGNPVLENMRSLDFPYGEDGDMTLMDVVPDSKIARISSNIEVNDIIDKLARGDEDVRRAAMNFMGNHGLASLSAASNYRSGMLSLSKWDRKVLAAGVPDGDVQPTMEQKNAAQCHLKKMLSHTGTFPANCNPVHFVLNGGRVEYLVKCRNHSVMRKVKEALRKCRKSISECNADNEFSVV